MQVTGQQDSSQCKNEKQDRDTKTRGKMEKKTSQTTPEHKATAALAAEQ